MYRVEDQLYTPGTNVHRCGRAGLEFGILKVHAGVLLDIVVSSYGVKGVAFSPLDP